MNITKNIINNFDFLCNESFECLVVTNNLEECVIYKGHGTEITITYDLREHTIDFGTILHEKYYPMAELVYRNAYAFTDFEIEEFENRCGIVITNKNIAAILDWFSKFISAHLRDLIKLP